MTNFPILGPAFRNNLLALTKAQRLIDETTLRLATGLKVNSALDNPQNYFSAKALGQRADDLSRRLDGIGASIRTVQEAITGVEAIEELLNLGASIATKALEEFDEDALTATQSVSTNPLNTLILADNPEGYWQLNDTGGGVFNAGSIGSAVDGSLVNGPALGEPALYNSGSFSIGFDGVNQGISIPNNALINTTNQIARTVELTFNADTTTGRQVLFEEGGSTHGLSIYIDNGALYVSGRQQGSWGPVSNMSAPINAGQTYHVAYVYDGAGGNFIGYMNGEELDRQAVSGTFAAHPANTGIGYMNVNGMFHDGPQTGSGFHFDGRISDVALYNQVLTEDALRARADIVAGTLVAEKQNEDFNKVLEQITQITEDARYRGIGLLALDTLTTLFNEDGSNRLITDGVDFSATGLEILYDRFDSREGIEAILASLRDALKNVRRFGQALTTDLNILTIRNSFTQSTINTLQSGSNDLTQTDTNEEGANLLALQIRQSLGITSLALAAQSNAGVLNLFV